MPKPGFKSITVGENVYNKFFDVYEKTKKDLELKGITSFSGYVTSMMEELMAKDETFARHVPYMERIAVDSDRVIIKDNRRNRIVEVVVRDGELRCLLDEMVDCIHTGFVYSLPEIYSVLTKMGVRPPRRLHT